MYMILHVKDVGVHPSGVIDIVVSDLNKFIKLLTENSKLKDEVSMVFTSENRAVVVLKSGVVLFIRRLGPPPIIR